MPLAVVPRQKWNAEQEMEEKRLEHPVSTVIVGYAKKTYSGFKSSPGARPNSQGCIEEIRYIQRGEIYRNNCDVRYNFMICGDGKVYEGRGWSRRSFLPSKYKQLRNKCIYIGYVGDFSVEKPPGIMFELKDDLIRLGVERGLIAGSFLEIVLANPFNEKVPEKIPTNYLSSIYM